MGIVTHAYRGHIIVSPSSGATLIHLDNGSGQPGTLVTQEASGGIDAAMRRVDRMFDSGRNAPANPKVFPGSRGSGYGGIRR